MACGLYVLHESLASNFSTTVTPIQLNAESSDSEINSEISQLWKVYCTCSIPLESGLSGLFSITSRIAFKKGEGYGAFLHVGN